MKRRRILPMLLSAAVTAAALWSYAAQPRRLPAGASFIPVQDGKTIDFSDGTPAVRDSAADKAAMDAAVKEMDAAAKDVTFPASAPQKK